MAVFIHTYKYLPIYVYIIGIYMYIFLTHLESCCDGDVSVLGFESPGPII